MRCAWREIASYVDVWWVPAFIGWFIVVFALNNIVPRPPWVKYWWQRSIMFKDKRRFDQWLRDTGLGWTIIVRRLVVAWSLPLFAWPLISPTVCENVVCRGNRGQLKPRTECLEQSGSQRDGVTPSASDTRRSIEVPPGSPLPMPTSGKG